MRPGRALTPSTNMYLLYAIGILVSLTHPALPLNQIGGVGGGGQKHKGLSVLSLLSISLKLCRFGAVVDNFAGFALDF